MLPNEKKQPLFKVHMSEYKDFPPFQYLLSVLKTAPESALLYVDLWKNKHEDNSVVINKNTVLHDYLISKTKIRNLLIPLIGIGLLSMKDHPTEYRIDLVPYDYDFDDYDPL